MSRQEDSDFTVQLAQDFAGAPDGLERLWTAHRMAYIAAAQKQPAASGENAVTAQGAQNSNSSGETCPFCIAPQQDDAQSLVVHRGQTAFVVLNLYPYNTGHLLVCPYRHVADYPDLTPAERQEVGELTATAMQVVRQVSKPHGFNLGMNQGDVAGAGIAAHLHQHVVPRWLGDANFFPIIAQTKAIPQLLSQTRELFAAAWPQSASSPAQEPMK